MRSALNFIGALVFLTLLSIPAFGAPPAPGKPDLDTSSDSGKSASDDVTKDNTPSFSGSCTPFYLVEVFAFDSQAQKIWLGSYTTNCVGGTYAVTAQQLPDGVYEIKARSREQNSADQSWSSPLIVKIDTTSPAPVVDLAAISDSGYSGSDNLTSNAGAVVEFKNLELGGSTIYARNAVQVGQFVNSSAAVAQVIGNNPAGTVEFSAAQTDVAGNTSSWGSLNVTFDFTPPLDPTVDLAQWSDSNISDDNVTNDLTPTIQIGLLENGGGFRLYRDGSNVGEGLASSPSTTDSVAGGDYLVSYQAIALDAAGNLSTPGPGLVVHFDSVAPPAPTTAPDLDATTDDGKSHNDNLTTQTGLTFNLTAQNPEDELLLVRDSFVMKKRTGSGQVSGVVGFLGNNVYAIRQADLAGNVSANGPQLLVKVVDGKPVANDDSYTVSASGGTAIGVADGVLVNDNDFFGKPLTSVLNLGPAHASAFAFKTDGSFTYTHDGSGQPDSFTYLVTNGTDASNVATVSITPDANPPAITSITPNSGPSYAPVTVTISGVNFVNGMTAEVGGKPLANVTVNGNQLTGTIFKNSLAAGTVADVKVKNPVSNGFARVTDGYVVDFWDVVDGQNIYHDSVEAIFRAGITGGCGGGKYCPDNPVTRGQMAVFVITAKYGPSVTMPDETGTVFGDVPYGHVFAKWIEKAAVDGITAGCGSGNYCPDASITRQEMAVFLLVAKHGAGYQPPPATGKFSDVPVSSPYAKWIEELSAEGITAGCGANVYCPTSPVTRGQMAAFLKATFALP